MKIATLTVVVLLVAFSVFLVENWGRAHAGLSDHDRLTVIAAQIAEQTGMSIAIN